MIKRLLLVSLILASSTSFAQELSQYTATRVQKAHELAQEEQVKQAITMLKEIDTSREYDQAFVARMLGVFYWQDGKPKQAIKHLEKAVTSGLLEDEQGWITERMLADLYLNEQQFERALKHYYVLRKSVPSTQKADDIWLRIAQSHYQLEQWSKVIPAANEYLKVSTESPLQPLSLKLGAQLQLKKWKQAIPTLELLIALQPEKINWWRQLVGLQLRIGKDRDALDTLSLAKLNKLELSQSDRRMLAQLYAKRGVPERAAFEISQLDGADTDVQLLSEQATYWQLAKEWDKALDVWKQAAKLDSKFHWNVAQLMVQQGYYRPALSVLAKVKGRKADVALAKTRAFYKLDQLDNALIEAKRANNVEPSAQSKSWIKYLTQLRQAKDQTTS
ncbi:tetratricopeptide repeat protein [Vibrio europaeus]|uniref:Tetratricopeptide repeat protein n=1 Tax=Vibrio europaeus TaxID=300876 RepID=A0AAE7DX01_9VIBR|nr:tetratricopeptide repeat protein [Vibrio europaeus]MDC5809416.1 tetratricopeptide repeat protein [Vibrio europaeus]QJY36336.1 tetratricopeptide repeat protein [Vibrio europaeus]QPG35147.1 tetratricopeptide repeat protein [Vibrio europaeus]